MFPQIPFKPGTSKVTGFSADVGKKFIDKDGNIYTLYQIDSDLSGDAFADGQNAVLKAGNIATNKFANATDTTNPLAIGVSCGAAAESAGATDSTIYYDLFLTDGVKTLLTNGDDDIAADDMLIAADLGLCDSVADNTTITDRIAKKKLGWALAADVDAANTVSARVNIG